MVDWRKWEKLKVKSVWGCKLRAKCVVYAFILKVAGLMSFTAVVHTWIFEAVMAPVRWFLLYLLKLWTVSKWFFLACKSKSTKQKEKAQKLPFVGLCMLFGAPDAWNQSCSIFVSESLLRLCQLALLFSLISSIGGFQFAAFWPLTAGTAQGNLSLRPIKPWRLFPQGV